MIFKDNGQASEIKQCFKVMTISSSMPTNCNEGISKKRKNYNNPWTCMEAKQPNVILIHGCRSSINACRVSSLECEYMKKKNSNDN